MLNSNSNVGKIKLKNINDLLIEEDSRNSSLLQSVTGGATEDGTPATFHCDRINVPPPSTTTSKKPRVKLKIDEDYATATPGTRRPRTSRKEPPPNQMRIDTFFHSASKTYRFPNELPKIKSASTPGRLEGAANSNEDVRTGNIIARKRICLGIEDEESQAEKGLEGFGNGKDPTSQGIKGKKTHVVKAIIDLCSDSDTEEPKKENTNIEEKDINPEILRLLNSKTNDFSPENTPSVFKRTSNTPDTSHGTTFSMPSSLATTKRRLRNVRNTKNLPEESTPALWRNKMKARTIKRGAVDANSNKTPLTALEALSATKKRPLKSHKRKISFSAIDNIPSPAGSKDKVGTNIHNKDELNLTETDGLQPLDEDSREGVFDLSVTGPKWMSITKTKKKEDPSPALKKSETQSTTTGRKRKPKIAPPFKVVEGTSFAVDAFCYGYIEGVTHYFLSHYHADHYMGLTRKFAMPLYASGITARLIQTFTPIDAQYLHILELNEPQNINGIEITAIDANHCPGAVMFIFKLPDGKCILHTGDFRASYEMESDPIFWNNHINTIYLDTTYISDKYAFCPQFESIDKAIDITNRFKEKHTNKKILFVCGSYVIGKEKFWLALAEEFNIERVWTEGNRKKALTALDNPAINKLLCDDPMESELHVIGLGKLSYEALKSYFKEYQQKFDILLAFRPSGWEKNAKPQCRGIINIVGIEYSEHSSYDEMRRFVKFLKPDNVISTVPYGGYSSTKCPQVPVKWYKYEKLYGRDKNFQTSISSYFRTPGKNGTTIIETKRTPPPKLTIKSIGKNNILEVTSTLNSTPMILMGSCTSSLDGVIEDLKKNEEDIDLLEDDEATIPDKKIEEIEDFIIQNVSEDDNVVVIDSSDSEIGKSDYTLEVNLKVSSNSPKKNSESASLSAPVMVQVNEYSADNDDDWLP